MKNVFLIVLILVSQSLLAFEGTKINEKKLTISGILNNFIIRTISSDKIIEEWVQISIIPRDKKGISRGISFIGKAGKTNTCDESLLNKCVKLQFNRQTMSVKVNHPKYDQDYNLSQFIDFIDNCQPCDK